ncbi:recombinase family protein, partial [Nonomuraea sp. NPDC050786]|uniref:recombinase family protein n=1 Tax=Nonomuraea sp. NPDC050786 TaxID=3154840 RepID=UPI0033E5796D
YTPAAARVGGPPPPPPRRRGRRFRVPVVLEEKISPAIQRDAIEALAARRSYYIPPGKWPDSGWIEDLDVSGRNFQRTIMAAISHVEKGGAKAILVWKYSRFGAVATGASLRPRRSTRVQGVVATLLFSSEFK